MGGTLRLGRDAEVARKDTSIVLPGSAGTRETNERPVPSVFLGPAMHNRPGGRMFRTARRVLIGIAAFSVPAIAQQPNDAEYTAKIKEYLRDPRITTELVDHLPASNTVPTPLKFHGRIIGTPGELTYSKDINR